MIRASDTGHRSNLSRKDMIVFEQRLVDAVSSFFPFKSHSIHFPRDRGEVDAAWIAGEKKLLLPLADTDGAMLGVFVARGLSQKDAATLLPHWPALRSLIADNLLLYKRSLSDPVTGLFSRHYLLRRMEREIETLRGAPAAQGMADGPAPSPSGQRDADVAVLTGGIGSPRRSSLATLVVRLAALRDVVREFGYQFADELMIALADALMEVCPEQALAARTGDSEFAVHLPSAGPRACRTLAAQIVQALCKVYLVHPLRREQVGIYASVGYTLYPQDAAGHVFVRPAAEQARLVLRKARLAAALAEEVPFSGRADAESVMGFGSILTEGGRVLEALPLSRVLVSLGSTMHAREGQRFSVWSMNYPDSSHEKRLRPTAHLAPLYKGEIVLMDVHDNFSQAEVIHLGEPGWAVEPGDHLVLLPEEQGSFPRTAPGKPRPDAATGLLRHGDFLARWAEERERCDSFALTLLRLAPKAGAENATEEEFRAVSGGSCAVETLAEEEGLRESPRHDAAQSPAVHPDHFMGEAVRLCLEDLGLPPGKIANIGDGATPLGGRYGLNSLIFFHPSPNPDSLTQRYAKLAKALEERLGLEAAVGIAMYPYLDFRKADTLENCQKALEYAILLPCPHVGLLDSLALNISADKRFSQGDTFGAIKEYQLALLADESNGIAWNSLGICLAGLNRHSEAERHFTRALECNADDAMALYNLGYMHQSQGRGEEAAKRYRECLGLEPGHLYALIRLGQVAENAGNAKEARAYYEKAAVLPGGKGLTYRHFARLCISEGKHDEAREHLHEALLYDPQDAMAMALLSGIYLDAGEDPEMAASFARQSVSLRPALRSGWLQLARAFEALGQEKEAKQAKLRAGGI